MFTERDLRDLEEHLKDFGPKSKKPWSGVSEATGVHLKGQVAAFETVSYMNVDLKAVKGLQISHEVAYETQRGCA
jgi:hypothetical protein